MDREHFYKLPEATDNNNAFRLQWRVDPRLRRYIHNRIPEDSSTSAVLAIAQGLVLEVRQLPPNREKLSPAARDLSGCIAALLAYTLFLQPTLGRRMQIQLRTNMFERLQRHLQGLELRDIYQIGLTLIFNPADFLNNFQPLFRLVR
ncbi:hypothetical protein [Chamaesiphon polymorphus]|uniref:Uncharacterized protein n=1 Tax=Chamaesiphon polymorphus CCALA 037 TaxID=2107692 RepID=A0A2T1FCJ9_9CYAN|nr:hypothetical protein [Chamaesiphon polymorphus]PSB42705.1 hypothetical protein C7B77_26585 [Chamaesiphon polymorphus CCALA 037]